MYVPSAVNQSVGDLNYSSLEEMPAVSQEQTIEEFDCYERNNKNERSSNGSELFCNVTWDGLSCWPTTLAGSIANVSCFAELNGVNYDISGNASRVCLENGTWSSWSNYRSCKALRHPDHEYLQVHWGMKDAATVYYVGYSFSLLALVLALWVFIHFKDLKCLRNSIHTNLMLTYLLIDVTWILTAILQSAQNYTAARIACFLVILLTYSMGTNFFWMFVEGLYLFMLVVKTFSVDSVKMRVYAVIGWGIPAIVAIIWAVVKGQLVHTAEDSVAPQSCPWQNRDNFDYIFIGPVVSVLLVNIFFLGKIMWVLITKLRASNTMESEQYRKAAKALLVLIPLLGVTYILVFATPSDPVAEVVFTYIQAALLSIQGFIVAVLYCFLNGEVQNSVRHHIERWKIRQAIIKGQQKSLRMDRSTQPDEGHKLYGNQRGVRGSCTSFSTSTSFVNFHSTITGAARSPGVPPQDITATPIVDTYEVP